MFNQGRAPGSLRSDLRMVQSRKWWSSTYDSTPSEARKRGSGGGSPRKYDDLLKVLRSWMFKSRQGPGVTSELSEFPYNNSTKVLTQLVYSFYSTTLTAILHKINLFSIARKSMARILNRRTRNTCQTFYYNLLRAFFVIFQTRHINTWKYTRR